jgi:hypothetical protein
MKNLQSLNEKEHLQLFQQQLQQQLPINQFSLNAHRYIDKGGCACAS